MMAVADSRTVLLDLDRCSIGPPEVGTGVHRRLMQSHWMAPQPRTMWPSSAHGYYTTVWDLGGIGGLVRHPGIPHALHGRPSSRRESSLTCRGGPTPVSLQGPVHP